MGGQLKPAGCVEKKNRVHLFLYVTFLIPFLFYCGRLVCRCVFVQSMNWFVDWLMGWLAGWLVSWLVGWWVKWLIGRSVDFLHQWLSWWVGSRIGWLAGWFIGSRTWLESSWEVAYLVWIFWTTINSKGLCSSFSPFPPDSRIFYQNKRQSPTQSFVSVYHFQMLRFAILYLRQGGSVPLTPNGTTCNLSTNPSRPFKEFFVPSVVYFHA